MNDLHTLLDDEPFQTSKQKIKLISTTQFLILSVATFGLYSLWWMYKAWKIINIQEHKAFRPLLRSLLHLLYLGSLFDRIQKWAVRQGRSSIYSVEGLFVMHWVLIIIGRFDSVWGYISLFDIVLFIQPHKALNYAVKKSKEYQVEEDQSFTKRQLVILFLGSLLWILVLWGEYLFAVLDGIYEYDVY